MNHRKTNIYVKSESHLIINHLLQTQYKKAFVSLSMHTYFVLEGGNLVICMYVYNLLIMTVCVLCLQSLSKTSDNYPFTYAIFQGFHKVGGMNKLYNEYPLAIPTPLVNGSDCGYPTDEAFNLLRNPTTSELPWPGNVFGITILSVWYFCSDQVNYFHAG